MKTPTKEISTLDRLRVEAKLHGEEDGGTRKVGREFRDKVKSELFKDLDACIAEAWDAIEIIEEDRGYRRECVTLELCSGADPYIKGFLYASRIPAFELRPPAAPTKSNSLSSRLEIAAFSQAVAEIPGKWWGEHPSELVENVPQILHLMSRTTVKFSKE